MFDYSFETIRLERAFRAGSASREDLEDACYRDRCRAKGLTVAEDIALRRERRKSLRDSEPRLIKENARLVEENAELRRSVCSLLSEVGRLVALLKAGESAERDP